MSEEKKQRLKEYQKRKYWGAIIIQTLIDNNYSDLTYTKALGVASQYILWCGSLWYPLRSSMLKNMQFFSLVILKWIPAFAAVQLDVAKNHINQYVAKNNSRSPRGVTKLSSALNFGMFAHSTTFASQFAHYTSKAGGFG